MTNDILGNYGPDSAAPEAPRATSGGVQQVKDIPYSRPVGPSNIGDAKSPGLHGENHGCGPQGKH